MELADHLAAALGEEVAHTMTNDGKPLARELPRARRGRVQAVEDVSGVQETHVCRRDLRGAVIAALARTIEVMHEAMRPDTSQSWQHAACTRHPARRHT